MDRYILAAVFFFFSTSAFAIKDVNILIKLEEPSAGAVASGVSNLRGWSVAPNGISHIELFINGVYIDTVPYGGLRTDVGSTFPSYPDSNNSGFSMAYGYSALNLGQNHAHVIVYDKVGNFNTVEADFQVEKFKSDWIGDPDEVDLRAAENIRVLDNNRLVVEGVVVEGEGWDVELKWQTATQGFDIARIEPTDSSGNPLVGQWVGEDTFSFEGESCKWMAVVDITATSPTTGNIVREFTLDYDNSPSFDCSSTSDSSEYSLIGTKVTFDGGIYEFLSPDTLIQIDHHLDNGKWKNVTSILTRQ